MNGKFKIEDMGCDHIRSLDPNFGEYNIKVRNWVQVGTLKLRREGT